MELECFQFMELEVENSVLDLTDLGLQSRPTNGGNGDTDTVFLLGSGVEFE